MPSSYTTSARFTLQATGENNNTWGVILNSGVFQLVDDNVNGRLAFSLSGAKVLTSALGAADEARLAFLDVTGGSGGSVTIPAVSKGYYVRNASSGDVTVTAGGALNALFKTGDIGPLFSDGASTYGLALSGKPLGQYIRDGDQAVIDYVNLAISQGNINLPPATAPDVGKALMVRLIGPTPAWVPSAIQASDVTGLISLAAANAWTGTQSFLGTSAVPAMKLRNAIELATVDASVVGAGNINYDVAVQSTYFLTSAPSANFGVNFRASVGTALSAFMANGDVVTVMLSVWQGATVFTINNLLVDGVAPAFIAWQGGTQPVPVANSRSVYTFAILRSGGTFGIFANMSRFG